ncbi:hypothetical protein PG995_015853 [Apiospora arundinis]
MDHFSSRLIHPPTRCLRHDNHRSRRSNAPDERDQVAPPRVDERVHCDRRDRRGQAEDPERSHDKVGRSRQVQLPPEGDDHREAGEHGDQVGLHHIPEIGVGRAAHSRRGRPVLGPAHGFVEAHAEGR